VALSTKNGSRIEGCHRHGGDAPSASRESTLSRTATNAPNAKRHVNQSAKRLVAEVDGYVVSIWQAGVLPHSLIITRVGSQPGEAVLIASPATQCDG
jgi:hypothetical protein